MYTTKSKISPTTLSLSHSPGVFPSIPTVITMLIMLLSLAQVSVCYPLICSPQCTYIYNSSLSKYQPGCTSTLDAQSCTQCDNTLYVLSNTSQCILNPTNIYNTSINIQSYEWTSNSNTSVVAIEGIGDWIKLIDITRISSVKNIDQIYGIGHYGYRCRMLLHRSTLSSQFYPQIYITHNLTQTNKIQILPQQLTSSIYPYNQWIYTSQHISHTSSNIILSISRNDTLYNPNITTDVVAFRELSCMIALCVDYCTMCTSLQDCMLCASGYYVDAVSHLCVGVCGHGQYLAEVGDRVCSMCSPYCQACMSQVVTNCTQCTTSGIYQSYLLKSTCYTTCPNGYIANTTSHTCQCTGAHYLSGLFCIQCDIHCSTCYGATSNQCCNSTLVQYYLYNYTCVQKCPIGYIGNKENSLCEVCEVGMYSYENTCVLECPQYYQRNIGMRACVVGAGGYPIKMRVQVENLYTLRFVVELPLGLEPGLLERLNRTWGSFIRIQFMKSQLDMKDKLIYSGNNSNSSSNITSQRLLAASSSPIILNLKKAQISSTSLSLSSSTITPEQLSPPYTFTLFLASPLYSPSHTAYSLSTSSPGTQNPSVVHQYYQLSPIPIFLVPLFYILICMLILVLNIRTVYQLFLQYLQCLQLIGLSLYILYPHNMSLYLYYFIYGFNISNFDFMYNIPASNIPACTSCISLLGYTFVVGDMDWLRLMGSLLLSVGIICTMIGMFYLILQLKLRIIAQQHIYIYRCKYWMRLLFDVVLVKVVHSWFSSLLYIILNYNNSNSSSSSNSMYMLFIHMLSIAALVPVIWIKINKIKNINNNNSINTNELISLIILMVYVVGLVLMGLAPLLVGMLMVLVAIGHWIWVYVREPAIVFEIPQTGVQGTARHTTYRNNTNNTNNRKQNNKNKNKNDSSSNKQKKGVNKQKKYINKQYQYQHQQHQHQHQHNQQQYSQPSHSHSHSHPQSIYYQQQHHHNNNNTLNKQLVHRLNLLIMLHKNLYKSLKPITIFLICCIVMIKSNTTSTNNINNNKQHIGIIIAVAIVYAVLLVLIFVDMMYIYHIQNMSMQIMDAGRAGGHRGDRGRGRGSRGGTGGTGDRRDRDNMNMKNMDINRLKQNKQAAKYEDKYKNKQILQIQQLHHTQNSNNSQLNITLNNTQHNIKQQSISALRIKNLIIYDQNQIQAIHDTERVQDPHICLDKVQTVVDIDMDMDMDMDKADDATIADKFNKSKIKYKNHTVEVKRMKQKQEYGERRT